MDEVDTRLRRPQALALLDDILTLVEFLDDGCTRGRTTDTVLLHRLAQFVVLDGLTGRFHRP